MSKKFIERHGLWTPEQHAQAAAVLSQIESEGLEIIRLSYADQHGLLRGKSLSVAAIKSAFTAGSEITMAPFFHDTGGAVAFNPFTPGGGFNDRRLQGAPNTVMVPDPATFRVLPWADKTGWLMADLYLSDGSPFPLGPRAILKRALADLESEGYRFNAGLEVEFYLTRIVDPGLSVDTIGTFGSPAQPPRVEPIAKGYSLHLENHLDEVESIVSIIRKHLLTLGLPLRSIEDELAPSQLEITFDVMPGLDVADMMCLFKNAIKQIARRHGYLASFMCRPGLPGFYASGWHLHQSLVHRETGENLFIPQDGEPLSVLGRQWVAGLLAHASATSSFATPTINGYRRRRPNSLAPDRVCWAIDNRAAMARVIAAPGDPASRVENRIGEPAANPYLYLASQIFSGLDGIRRKLQPGEPQDSPYLADLPTLPANLALALQALEGSAFLREQYGEDFCRYWLTLHRNEWSRFIDAGGNTDMQVEPVTEWEHREYFELM